jgi:hypothetical protein
MMVLSQGSPAANRVSPSRLSDHRATVPSRCAAIGAVAADLDGGSSGVAMIESRWTARWPELFSRWPPRS